MTQRIHLVTRYAKDGSVTWCNEEEQPIIIVDSKVQFYSKDLACSFSLFVKGTKGRGVTDADKLTKLSRYHIPILRLMCDGSGNTTMTGVQIRLNIKYKIQHHLITTFKQFIDNNWMRPISELLRRGLLVKDKGDPKLYTIQRMRSLRCLETGKFEP